MRGGEKKGSQSRTDCVVRPFLRTAGFGLLFEGDFLSYEKKKFLATINAGVEFRLEGLYGASLWCCTAGGKLRVSASVIDIPIGETNPFDLFREGSNKFQEIIDTDLKLVQSCIPLSYRMDKEDSRSFDLIHAVVVEGLGEEALITFKIFYRKKINIWKRKE
ncbi:hypothetical protein CEXT_514751 [Caerostris extrusa]|uniref:Uncharacterized protein n=1 Tax=Caerostris extrusa TaxID=172846 RepID=A0AAV4TBX0_CAEEX|nr:hypothetical protein CEXT_514751 [Caerostris extrusa]